jgi:hypothetical protein
MGANPAECVSSLPYKTLLPGFLLLQTESTPGDFPPEYGYAVWRGLLDAGRMSRSYEVPGQLPLLAGTASGDQPYLKGWQIRYHARECFRIFYLSSGTRTDFPP